MAFKALLKIKYQSFDEDNFIIWSELQSATRQMRIIKIISSKLLAKV